MSGGGGYDHEKEMAVAIVVPEATRPKPPSFSHRRDPLMGTYAIASVPRSYWRRVTNCQDVHPKAFNPLLASSER